MLLEGPLAEIFGASRSPVRQALRLLEREGLLHAFDGRGLLVGRARDPVRIPVTRGMFPSLTDHAEITGPRMPA